MAPEIEFINIVWNHEGNHDKVWCAFKVNNAYYAAWGRRNKKLQFKKHSIKYDLNNLAAAKRKKGYKVIDEFTLFSLFPDFKEKVEEGLFVAQLSDEVK